MEVQNGVSADLIYFQDSVVSTYADGNGNEDYLDEAYDLSKIEGESVINTYKAVYDSGLNYANDILTGSDSRDAFVVESGADTVIGFAQGDILVLDPANRGEYNVGPFGTYGYWDYVDDALLSFYVNEGSVTIVDSWDKTIPVVDAGGKGVVHAYVMSPDARGAINGDPYTGQFIGIGSSGHANEIYAGSNGSSLWGGVGDHNDTLIGGSGSDWFIYDGKNGQDVIVDAGSGDVVEVKHTGIRGGGILDNDRAVFVFEGGGSLVVDGQADMFIVDGTAYATDYNTRTLSQITSGSYFTYDSAGNNTHYYSVNSNTGRWQQNY